MELFGLELKRVPRDLCFSIKMSYTGKTEKIEAHHFLDLHTYFYRYTKL